MKKFPIKIGNTIIADLLNPQPEELDLEAMTLRLKGMYRFSGAPGALNIHQHRHLVNRLVRESRADFVDGPDGENIWERCCEWAYHHDDHEGVLGDIVAPVKNLISAHTSILEVVEVKLDKAICFRRGIRYPSEIVRGLVYRYDKAAETIEWVYALGNRLQESNHPCPDDLMVRGKQLIQWARQHT